MVHKGKRAIVIGGSMGGLLASRVLADHFDEVTIVDRDTFPTSPEHPPLRASEPPHSWIAGQRTPDSRALFSRHFEGVPGRRRGAGRHDRRIEMVLRRRTMHEVPERPQWLAAQPPR